MTKCEREVDQMCEMLDLKTKRVAKHTNERRVMAHQAAELADPRRCRPARWRPVPENQGVRDPDGENKQVYLQGADEEVPKRKMTNDTCGFEFKSNPSEI